MPEKKCCDNCGWYGECKWTIYENAPCDWLFAEDCCSKWKIKSQPMERPKLIENHLLQYKTIKDVQIISIEEYMKLFNKVNEICEYMEYKDL